MSLGSTAGSQTILGGRHEDPACQRRKVDRSNRRGRRAVRSRMESRTTTVLRGGGARSLRQGARRRRRPLVSDRRTGGGGRREGDSPPRNPSTKAGTGGYSQSPKETGPPRAKEITTREAPAIPDGQKRKPAARVYPRDSRRLRGAHLRTR